MARMTTEMSSKLVTVSTSRSCGPRCCARFVRFSCPSRVPQLRYKNGTVTQVTEAVRGEDPPAAPTPSSRKVPCDTCCHTAGSRLPSSGLKTPPLRGGCHLRPAVRPQASATPLWGRELTAVTTPLPSLPQDPRPGDRAPHPGTCRCDCPVCPDRNPAPCPARAATPAPSPTPWSRWGLGWAAGQAHNPPSSPFQSAALAQTPLQTKSRATAPAAPTPSDRTAVCSTPGGPRSCPAW